MTEQNKKAFTLAEVLITLGIIGVVAAMTLPVLIQKHQNQVYVTQLKKAYSTIEQAFQMAMTEDGVDDIGQTQMFGNLGLPGTDRTFCVGSEMCAPFFNELRKYISPIEKLSLSDYKIKSIAKGSTPYAVSSVDSLSSNGYFIFNYRFYNSETEYFPYSRSFMKANYGWFDIDVNGKKGPNTYGRDIFTFHIAQNGKLVPQGSKILNDYDGFQEVWTRRPIRCGTPGKADAETSVTDTTTGGKYCTARVIENGWKMDY